MDAQPEAPIEPAIVEATEGADPAAALIARMRADLKAAMRAKDQVRVRALRTGLGAIANAEAPPIVAAPSSATEPVVGRLVEHQRLVLTVADIERILRDEIADRDDTATQFETHGRESEAEIVRAEASVLVGYVR